MSKKPDLLFVLVAIFALGVLLSSATQGGGDRASAVSYSQEVTDR